MRLPVSATMRADEPGPGLLEYHGYEVAVMYLDFFKLSEYPFSTECDHRYFYESPAHAEAMANMVYCIEQRKGMVMVTGEVGAGKTLLARILARRLANSTKLAMLAHPCHTAAELLRSTADELGIATDRQDDRRDLVVKLERRLRTLHDRGRTALLILDEVQSMRDEALEEIRMMWNFESDDRRLLQFVLIGQPELRRRLRQPQWESLQQRIALAFHLDVLDPVEAGQYVLHRCRIAANEGCPLQFTRKAFDAIQAATGGAPRRINVLCDNTLLLAYAAGETKITSTLVDKAAHEMTCWMDPDLDPEMPDDVDPPETTSHQQLRIHREAAGK